MSYGPQPFEVANLFWDELTGGAPPSTRSAARGASRLSNIVFLEMGDERAAITGNEEAIPPGHQLAHTAGCAAFPTLRSS